MVNIVIDGAKLEVPEGKNVLECALDAGIYIPHLCHHKDLSPLGSCRMCIVEVDGQEGVLPACTLEAQDGMVIRTKTPKLQELRMLALELLLAGHPAECTGCPKYGNCELQVLIQYIGPKTGRLKMRVKGFKPNEENPLIVHDMNRCVLCGRCVRACNDLRGVKVLQYQKKEMETYVGTLHDRLLKDADCRFCGACVAVCPTGTIRDKLMDTETSKEEQIVPCRAACPANIDIPRYVRYVKNGEYDEAAAVVREKVPFPKSLGYICSHVCELQCKRKEVNEAVSIRNLKRYAAEQDTGSKWMEKGKQLPDSGKKVCVVGAGPAGMTAAYYLRKQGHEMTVKEALPTVGGMMAYGIPAYRLPRDIIQEEAEIIRRQGVTIEVNAEVTDLAELEKTYDAILLATGCHRGVRLPMEGKDLDGVLVNAEFLRKASMGQETGMGQRVIVLGGGNVAFDCARTARRLGAKEVHLACLELREAMTADEEEILQAQEEGIVVHPGQTFERITGDTHASGVDFMNVKSFYFDENRRAVIEKEEGSEHHIEADTVIFAVGQVPDQTDRFGIELQRGSYLAVADQQSDKRTSKEGVFAAGDAVYGTRSVIAAIASGREAAIQMDKYLGGDGDISETFAKTETPDGYIGRVEGFGYLERNETKIDPVECRCDNMHLFDHGFCDADAQKEASRCLQCDLRLQIAKGVTWNEFGTGEEVSQ